MSTQTSPSFFGSLAGKVFGTAMIPVALFLALIGGYALPNVHRLLVSTKKEGLGNGLRTGSAIAPAKKIGGSKTRRMVLCG